MTSRSPFKDLPSCQKCCQWAALNQQPFWGPHTCNDRSCGCIKTRPLVMSGNPEGPPSSRAPMGSAKVVWAASSLISPSTLSCFFPLDSTSVDPKGTPNTHPNINLHLNLYPREPTSNMYPKKKIPVLRFPFENHWLCTYLQHFKKPKRNTKR